MSSKINSLLNETIHDLGIDVIDRHIFLCADQTEPKCSPKRKTLESWNFLKSRLAELEIDNRGGIYRSKVNCLRVCTNGPIAVVGALSAICAIAEDEDDDETTVKSTEEDVSEREDIDDEKDGKKRIALDQQH